jgi:hypothetical protein
LASMKSCTDGFGHKRRRKERRAAELGHAMRARARSRLGDPK